jgi:hypothetical protein
MAIIYVLTDLTDQMFPGVEEKSWHKVRRSNSSLYVVVGFSDLKKADGRKQKGKIPFSCLIVKFFSLRLPSDILKISICQRSKSHDKKYVCDR